MVQEPSKSQLSKSALENMKVWHRTTLCDYPVSVTSREPLAVSPGTSRSRDYPCWGPSSRHRWPGTTVASSRTVSERCPNVSLHSEVIALLGQNQVQSKYVFEINSKFSSSPALALAKEGVPLGVPVVIPHHWRCKDHLPMCAERCWIPTSTKSIGPVHGLTNDKHDAIWRYLEYFWTMWMCISLLQNIKKAKGSQIVPFPSFSV